ncbi:MAG: WG repeat-containing protein [Planctomycetota bacterium]|nr:WG repeat-containing protein [Planctomycetota bacterium]
MSLQDARFFSGDYAVVRTKEGRSAVIDTEGALAYRCETGESIIGHVAAGKVLVFQENSGIYTYLELSSAKKCGNYTFATPYLWGFATVESDEGRRLIDANGVSVAEESYILERMNLNSTGPTVLESTTQTPELFPVALAFNRVFELGSFLESKRVVSFPHWLTTDFSEGVAVFAFETGDKEVSYGFCYADGELLTSLPFSEARSFSCGVAAVREKHSGLWGYINKSGKWINGKRYNNAWSFHNGFAVVESGEEERYAIIDRSGNELWRAPPGHRILESHGPYWPVEIYRKLHGREKVVESYTRSGGRTTSISSLHNSGPREMVTFSKARALVRA